LSTQKRRYDLAYIDGSHDRCDVMADSLGVWSMLNLGGSIIWDDYRWGRHHLPLEQRPQSAIDEFLREREGQYRVLSKGYQMIIERLRACCLFLIADARRTPTVILPPAAA